MPTTIDLIFCALARNSQLHAECGAAFTSKLDGMFRDIELSKELREAYRQFSLNQSDASSSSLSSSSSSSSLSTRSSAASSAADLLEAQVLTQGVWPPYADAVGAGGELPVPVEVVRAQEAFKNFYLSKHTGMAREGVKMRVMRVVRGCEGRIYAFMIATFLLGCHLSFHSSWALYHLGLVPISAFSLAFVCDAHLISCTTPHLSSLRPPHSLCTLSTTLPSQVASSSGSTRSHTA